MEPVHEDAREMTIDAETCMTLLATHQVGRLVTGGSRLQVRPVNYVMAGHDLYFRTDRPLQDEPQVAFEVDQIDTSERQAWSVVIEGRVVAAEFDVGAAEVFDHLEPWGAGAKSLLMRLVIDAVSGRWVRAARAVQPLEQRGYM